MLSFKIRYTAGHGEISVTINEISYVYFLDAGHIPKIERMSKHRPGKALEFLKEVAYHYERRTT